MIEGQSTELTGFNMMPAMVTSTFEADDTRREIWTRGAIRHLLRDCTERQAFPCRAWLDPAEARANERTQVSLHLAPTDWPIVTGGRVVLLLPQFWGGIVQERDPTTYHLWRSPRTYPGYISSHIRWETDAEASIGGTITCCGSVHTALALVVEDGRVERGDELVIVIGDERGLAPLTVEFAGTYRFGVLVDGSGSDDWRSVQPAPAIRVTPGPADRLRVTLPACREEAEVTPRVVALDAHLNLADDAPAGEVGTRSVGPARVATVACPGRGLAGVSNPSVTGPWVEGLNVYFGEIHSHCELSDGVGTIDDGYAFARDALGLDFAAMTDHFEYTQPTLYYPPEERWPRTIEAAERFNEPGRFVTLLGYEWGGRPHINVYYRGGEGEILTAQTDCSRTATDLWASLHELGRPVVTIPHHPKFISPADWREHDDRLQRLVEVYSGWGSSELGSEHTARAALQRGLRLGFIAGTDNHIGRPGQGNRTHEGGGLACVLAPELTREAIFDALVARRCYATTGARMLLDLRVNGALMGSEAPMAQKRSVTVRAIGEADIRRVEIVSNGAVVHTEQTASQVVELLWEERSRQAAWYYARLSQADGHQAWSSPVWIR